jgi:predicted lipoprotein
MFNVKSGVVILLVINLLSLTSCKKDDQNDENLNFEKATLLENIATNCIISGYEDLNTKLSDFETKYSAFTANQTIENFEATKNAWKNTYLQWQNVLMFEFGPAMDKLLQASVGTFPTDTTKIISNITANSYDLAQVSNITAQGLPAFDFLLFRNNAMSYFAQTNYSNYGLALIQKMEQDVSSVVTSWKTSYTTTFKASTGTESTSSFSIYVNQYVKSYEQTKWTKLGIPLGKQSLGVHQPAYIEARKSTISIALLLANIKASQRLFNGDHANGTKGIGFDDYLIALNRNDLVTTINASFAEIIGDISAISSSFENSLSTNPQALDAIYTKIHNLTVSLKTDMTSAFGILITYQDNDGD